MNHEADTAQSVPSASRDPGAESISGLISNLTTDLSSLLGKELKLAKSEVRESVSGVQTAVGAIAVGAAIAMAGLVALLMSAVYGLSNVVDPWLAALIVGTAALLLGFLMIQSAKSKMNASAIVPERTVESAKQDKATVQRSTQ